MINRIFNSFFIGFILYLLLDFLFFIGIKNSYLDAYGIKEYYNVLFVDHQNYIFMFFASLVFGYLIATKKYAKVFTYFYILMIFLSLLTLYPPIGEKISKMIFEKKSISFRIGKIKFKGDILYKGRKCTYIYRKDINKVIKLKNSDFVTF